MKKLWLVGMVFLLSILFAGCSSGDDEDEDPDKGGGGDGDNTEMLVPSAGELVPEFKMDVVEYELLLSNENTEVRLTYQKGETVLAAKDCDDLAEGSTDVLIEGEGIAKSYTVKIIRLPSAALEKIVFTGTNIGDSSITLNSLSETIAYTFPRADYADSVNIGIAITAKNTGATIAVSGISEISAGSGNLIIDNGAKKEGVISVSVPVEGHEAVTKTYALKLSRSNQAAMATGGDIKFIDVEGIPYEVHTFTSPGTLTFSLPAAITNVNVLVVAGGGGGGYMRDVHNGSPGGGGGAGGLIYKTGLTLDQVEYEVVIGDGGAGAQANGQNGANGADSRFAGLTAKGGGGGAYHPGAGLDGGSGGGGTYTHSGGAATQGSETGNYGNRGGNLISGSGDFKGFGGGGAGAPGGDYSQDDIIGGKRGFAGGDGMEIAITGTKVWYAGGGAAGRGHEDVNTAVKGGKGGGGDSNTGGKPNTGGGGGGGSYNSGFFQGGSGGSGIVIVRFPAE